MDAVGSAIRVDTRGREVMRILPRINDEVNEEWISDKTRHVVDGLRVQRLDQPYVRVNGRLEPAIWAEAFRAIAAKVKATRPARHRRHRRRPLRRRGDERAEGAGRPARLAEPRLPPGRHRARPQVGPRELSLQRDHRRDRRGRRHPAGRHQSAQGSAGAQRPHPQALAPRRTSRSASSASAPISPTTTPISAPAPRRSPRSLDHKPADAQAPDLARRAGRADAAGRRRRALRRRQGRRRDRRAGRRLERLLACCTPRPRASAASTSASCRAQGGLARRGDGRRAGVDRPVPARRRRDRRSSPAPSSSISAPMATAARTAPTSSCRAPPIPRRPATYVNTEGRVQRAGRAAFPPGEAREDWAILRALSDVLGQRLPYDSLPQLRAALFRAHPHLATRRRHRARQRRGRARARQDRRQLRQGAVQVADRGFLSHQSDRARVRGDGGMLGARRNRGRGGGVGRHGRILHRLRLAADRHRRAEPAAARRPA